MMGQVHRTQLAQTKLVVVNRIIPNKFDLFEMSTHSFRHDSEPTQSRVQFEGQSLVKPLSLRNIWLKLKRPQIN